MAGISDFAIVGGGVVLGDFVGIAYAVWAGLAGRILLRRVPIQARPSAWTLSAIVSIRSLHQWVGAGVSTICQMMARAPRVSARE